MVPLVMYLVFHSPCFIGTTEGILGHHLALNASVLAHNASKPQPQTFKMLPFPKAGGEKALTSWMKALDYHSGDYPGLLYFDSQEHLIELLTNMSLSDFQNISSRMANRTTALLNETLAFWDGALSKVASLNASGRVRT